MPAENNTRKITPEIQKNCTSKVSEKELRRQAGVRLSIPQGNTSRGVNHFIAQYILDRSKPLGWKTLLDIPCGSGIFAQSIKMLTGLSVVGADVIAEPKYLPTRYYEQINAADPSIGKSKHAPFDVVTCISGVMEFGNTSRFLEFCHDNMARDGHLIVTNDSIVTIQDRLLFLMLGRTRRMKLLRIGEENIWNLFPVGTLVRMLHDADFEVLEIEYFIDKPKNYWMVPLAALLYPFQAIYVKYSSFFEKVHVRPDLKREMYQFKSLFCTHYAVVCRRLPKPL